MSTNALRQIAEVMREPGQTDTEAAIGHALGDLYELAADQLDAGHPDGIYHHALLDAFRLIGQLADQLNQVEPRTTTPEIALETR